MSCTESIHAYLEVHPALTQDLTGLGHALQEDMLLHAQLLDQTLTLGTVHLILPLVAIHQKLVVCSNRGLGVMPQAP